MSESLFNRHFKANEDTKSIKEAVKIVKILEEYFGSYEGTLLSENLEDIVNEYEDGEEAANVLYDLLYGEIHSPVYNQSGLIELVKNLQTITDGLLKKYNTH